MTAKEHVEFLRALKKRNFSFIRNELIDPHIATVMQEKSTLGDSKRKSEIEALMRATISK